MDASGHAFEIPIENSRALDNFDPTVERIVVVIHGSSQNAGDYRRRVEAAAAMRPGEAGRTLVVAPQFLEEADAGGQFVQRYAAGTPTVERHPGIAFRFVVANAGSYLYLSPEREVPGALGTFAVPASSQQAACPYWNDYKYGLRTRAQSCSIRAARRS
ncbi:MAG: hypothetical protein ACREI8_14395 [Myxococcota bacterium]